MAFNEKEQAIIQWGTNNGKTPEEIKSAVLRFRETGSPRDTTVQPEVDESGFLQRAGQVGVGFGKGLAETAVETASLLQTGGQAVLAGVDPTRSFSDVREQTGFPTLQGQKLEGIRSTLSSQNPEQRAGKILAFGAELLAPVAKPSLGLIGRAVERGRQAIGVGQKSAFNTVEDLASKGVVKIEDVLNPIDPGVETVLRRTTPERFNEYVNATRLATTEPKASTALEIAGKKAEGALDTIQRKLSQFGSQKSSILEQASVGNKPVGNIVVKYRQQLGRLADERTLDATDQRILSEIQAEAQKLGSNPKAKEVDKFIDFVQDKLFTSQRNLSIDVTEPTVARLRGVTGELNEALKTQLPQSYRNANQQYADLVTLRNELNQKLGKEGERAGSLMKRVFSPSDGRTKEMFQEVLDVTGVDLVDEAVLARYTMDVFGDTRQRNLLQTVLESRPRGFVEQAIDRGMDFFLGRFSGTEAELRKALRIIAEDPDSVRYIESLGL